MTLPPTKHLITRRDWARQTVAGAAGVLLASALPAPAAPPPVVDPAPAFPPPLPAPAAAAPTTEGDILIRLVPAAAGYALSDTQAKEAALQLRDYPGGFAKARAYPLPDSVGPAFAAAAPVRKERVK